MFIGEYNHSIDPKGRLAIPAKFRLALKDGAVVTRGLDDCLFIYPKKVWMEEAEKLAKLSKNQANHRSYARFFLSGASEVVFDSQGRIMIPEPLRKFANLEKKAIVAGLFDRLEIWDQGKWEENKKHMERNGASIAEAIGEFGI